MSITSHLLFLFAGLHNGRNFLFPSVTNLVKLQMLFVVPTLVSKAFLRFRLCCKCLTEKGVLRKEIVRKFPEGISPSSSPSMQISDYS